MMRFALAILMLAASCTTFRPAPLGADHVFVATGNRSEAEVDRDIKKAAELSAALVAKQRAVKDKPAIKAPQVVKKGPGWWQIAYAFFPMDIRWRRHGGVPWLRLDHATDSKAAQLFLHALVGEPTSLCRDNPGQIVSIKDCPPGGLLGSAPVHITKHWDEIALSNLVRAELRYGRDPALGGLLQYAFITGGTAASIERKASPDETHQWNTRLNWGIGTTVALDLSCDGPCPSGRLLFSFEPEIYMSTARRPIESVTPALAFVTAKGFELDVGASGYIDEELRYGGFGVVRASIPMGESIPYSLTLDVVGRAGYLWNDGGGFAYSGGVEMNMLPSAVSSLLVGSALIVYGTVQGIQMI